MKYQKFCIICQQKFETKRKATLTCSRSCASYYRYSKTINKREERFANYIKNKNKDFSYVSGFLDRPATRNFHVMLHCHKNNEDFKAYASDIRQSNFKCLCERSKPKPKIKMHVSNLNGVKVFVLSKTNIKKLQNMKHKHFYLKSHCKECGRKFVTYTKSGVYCSKKCVHKHINRLKSYRKEKRWSRAKDNGNFDGSITLAKLFERDNGMCYLCGKKLDLTSDYNRPNAPTIEHILPICKGGTHTWDNVKLACRVCNVAKGVKVLTPLN